MILAIFHLKIVQLRFQHVRNLQIKLWICVFLYYDCICLYHLHPSFSYPHINVQSSVSKSYILFVCESIIYISHDFYHIFYQLYPKVYRAFRTYVHFKHKYRQHRQEYVTNILVLHIYLKSLTKQLFENAMLAQLHLQSLWKARYFIEHATNKIICWALQNIKVEISSYKLILFSIINYLQ